MRKILGMGVVVGRGMVIRLAEPTGPNLDELDRIELERKTTQAWQTAQAQVKDRVPKFGYRPGTVPVPAKHHRPGNR